MVKQRANKAVFVTSELHIKLLRMKVDSGARSVNDVIEELLND